MQTTDGTRMDWVSLIDEVAQDCASRTAEHGRDDSLATCAGRMTIGH